MLLSKASSNWEEWRRRITLIVDQRQFSDYLDGSLPCPDDLAHPDEAAIWTKNDKALHAFLLQHISDLEWDFAAKFTTSHTVYEALRLSHENLGLHVQIHLLQQAMNTRFSDSVPYSQTLSHIDRLHDRSIKMGKMDDDKLRIGLYINVLGHNPRFQSIINDMLDTPGITAADVRNKILRKEQFARYSQTQTNPGTAPGLVALAATSTSNANRTRFFCTVCC